MPKKRKRNGKEEVGVNALLKNIFFKFTIFQHIFVLYLLDQLSVTHSHGRPKWGINLRNIEEKLEKIQENVEMFFHAHPEMRGLLWSCQLYVKATQVTFVRWLSWRKKKTKSLFFIIFILFKIFLPCFVPFLHKHLST